MQLTDVKAVVGIKYRSGKIKVISVEMGGNPAYCGAILYSKYQQKEKVEELLKLGNLLYLGENVNPEPSKQHSITWRVRKANLCRKSKRWSLKVCGRTYVEEFTCELLQKGVSVSEFRDTWLYINDRVEEKKNYKARTYRSVRGIQKHYKVDLVYLYDECTGRWTTYGIDKATGSTIELDYLEYGPYIENLLYHGDISDLTRSEKYRLTQQGFKVRY